MNCGLIKLHSYVFSHSSGFEQTKNPHKNCEATFFQFNKNPCCVHMGIVWMRTEQSCVAVWKYSYFHFQFICYMTVIFRDLRCYLSCHVCHRHHLTLDNVLCKGHWKKFAVTMDNNAQVIKCLMTLYYFKFWIAHGTVRKVTGNSKSFNLYWHWQIYAYCHCCPKSSDGTPSTFNIHRFCKIWLFKFSVPSLMQVRIS